MKVTMICLPSLIHWRNKKFSVGKRDGKGQRGNRRWRRISIKVVFK